jgi:histidinol dehydrogenase
MQILDWHSLDAEERRSALARPALHAQGDIAAQAQRIIATVHRDGDAALLRYAREFDGVTLDALHVSPAEFAAARTELTAPQIEAITIAIENVERFHRAQITAPLSIETAPGVMCERISVPVRAVGLYVPAGTAPLPSTAIMLAVPAALAGCPVRIMCTAPTRSGGADPAVLVAARKAGIERVFKVGGAQAIAAMAYGTASIPKCDKIVRSGQRLGNGSQIAGRERSGRRRGRPAGRRDRSDGHRRRERARGVRRG